MGEKGKERLLLRCADKKAGLDREMGVTRAQLEEQVADNELTRAG